MKSPSHILSRSLLLFLLCFTLFCLPIYAQESKVYISVKLQHNFYPQWGIDVGFVPGFLDGRVALHAGYTTSRIEAGSSNSLSKDNMYCALGYHPFPEEMMDPFLSLELGYTTFDKGANEAFNFLTAQSFTLTPTLGTAIHVPDLPLSVFGELGYSVLQSHTVLPVVYSFGLTYAF